jgi:hypothetical protein
MTRQLNQFTVKYAEVEVKIVSSNFNPGRTFSGKINTPLPEGKVGGRRRDSRYYDHSCTK